MMDSPTLKNWPILPTLDSSSVANTKPIELDYVAPLAVFENLPFGRTVGKFTTSAASGESANYELRAGDGDAGNGYFHLLTDGTLTTAESFDYEGEQTLSYTGGAILSSGKEVVNTFEVRVLNDWEDEPYQGNGLGTFSGHALSDSPDYSNESVIGTSGGYSSSEDEHTEQQAGHIYNPVDENVTYPPLRIFTKLTVVENVPLGSVVAQFVGEDVDMDEELSYSLATGLWDVDNHLFTVDENGTLRTAKEIDYEKDTELSIHVRTTDPHGAYLGERFLIEVIDLDEDIPVLELLGDETMTHGVGLPFYDPGAVGLIHRMEMDWFTHPLNLREYNLAYLLCCMNTKTWLVMMQLL